MSQPPQPSGQQPWGQQPPQWGAPPPSWGPPPPSWGPPPPQWGPPPGQPSSGAGSTPLLALGLVTAVLAALGTVLPSETYPDDAGSYGPLLQTLGDTVRFQAAGLVLLVGVVLLVVGALLRARAAGTGLLLVGAGAVGLYGLQLVVALLQNRLGVGSGGSVAVGGVLLVLAGCTATATAVLALRRLARPR